MASRISASPAENLWCRKGCADLILGIRKIPGVETITMTTNGVLLGNYAKQLKEAGVDGVNISLDTLDPEEFCQITGKREFPGSSCGDPGGKRCRIAGKAECSQSKRTGSGSIGALCTE